MVRICPAIEYRFGLDLIARMPEALHRWLALGNPFLGGSNGCFLLLQRSHAHNMAHLGGYRKPHAGGITTETDTQLE